VGMRGLREKDITLDIAKRLLELFRKHLPKASVVMTRSSDHFVSLPDRVRKANEENPDVFISLHVNASESKRSQGFEIFSLDVASDRHAERLAASENKIMGQKERGLPFILADLKAYSYRRESDLLAHLIARGVKTQTQKINKSFAIVDRGYNQAIFHVLFVNSPAVIAELFFISNPEEEKMLSEKTSREYIARGIFLGTKKFLDYQMASRERHAASR
jgi:N-acetylmuramoyl-L-alanine amidase